MEKEAHLLELARYVVLNAVRAGMVERVDDWPRSSYRAMIGADPAPAWLQRDWLLGQFGEHPKRAVAEFIDFVRAGVGLPSVWEALRQQIYLGSDEFVLRMQRALPSGMELAEIPRIQKRPVAKPLAYYAEQAASPKAAMAQAYLSGDYSMKEIARHFGVHYSTVSRAVREYELG